MGRGTGRRLWLDSRRGAGVCGLPVWPTRAAAAGCCCWLPYDVCAPHILLSSCSDSAMLTDTEEGTRCERTAWWQDSFPPKGVILKIPATYLFSCRQARRMMAMLMPR